MTKDERPMTKKLTAKGAKDAKDAKQIPAKAGMTTHFERISIKKAGHSDKSQNLFSAQSHRDDIMVETFDKLHVLSPPPADDIYITAEKMSSANGGFAKSGNPQI